MCTVTTTKCTESKKGVKLIIKNVHKEKRCPVTNMKLNM